MTEATAATHVALLRGVNVGGRRRLPMARLRESFVTAGCREVVTYLQSGNAVFVPPAPLLPDLPRALEEQLRRDTGLVVPVAVRDVERWTALVAALPFDEDDPTRVHVAFVEHEVGADLAAAMAGAAAPGEAFVVAGREIYLHLPDGMGRARMPAVLARAGGAVTVRNWRTVVALADLLGPGPPRQ